MNKMEYLTRLKAGLSRLPREEINNVMSYYEEYFDDAGPENEQAVIEELGSPSDVAGKVIAEMAVRYMREKEYSPGNKLKGVWIGVLAVFASPIALPLAVAAVMVILAMIMTAAAVGLAIILAAAGTVMYAVCGVFVGGYHLFAAPATGIAILGSTLIAAGISIYLIKCSSEFGKWVYHTIVSLLTGLFSRRKRA